MSPLGSFTLFLVLLASQGSLQKSTPASLTYRSAVVEFEPVIYSNDSKKTLNDNAKKFVHFIEEASSKNVDIIVFPELALSPLGLSNRSELMSWSTLVPDPSNNFIPFKNSGILVSDVLRDISCAAERNSIYVVASFIENEPCSDIKFQSKCPEDRIFFYTTSVAFDRNGKVIARYRKSNGFKEFGVFDKPKFLNISTIETDFGVTFGNVIGLDIFYKEPGLTLTRKLAITDFVYPTAFNSKMPFMTAIQTQAGWAYAKDVNLLAAGYNRVNKANFGSGIYAGRQGVLKSTTPVSKTGNQILIAEVTKKPKRETGRVITEFKSGTEEDKETGNGNNGRPIHDELRKRRDLTILPNLSYEKFEGFETVLVRRKGDESSLDLDISHNGIVCKLKVNFIKNRTQSTVPIFRFVAFDGQIESLGVRICAMIICGNDSSLDSCGRLESSIAIFRSVEIKANFGDTDYGNLVTPSTLAYDLIPISVNKWNFTVINEQKRATIFLNEPTDNIVTFGLWGRNFESSGANCSSNPFYSKFVALSIILNILLYLCSDLSSYSIFVFF